MLLLLYLVCDLDLPAGVDRLGAALLARGPLAVGPPCGGRPCHDLWSEILHSGLSKVYQLLIIYSLLLR